MENVFREIDEIEIRGTEEEPIYSPTLVAMWDENLWVVDRSSSKVAKFSPSGVRIVSMGSLGEEGPGEFQYPRWLQIGRDGDVLVFDVMRQDIQRFDSTGVYIERVNIPIIGSHFYTKRNSGFFMIGTRHCPPATCYLWEMNWDGDVVKDEEFGTYVQELEIYDSSSFSARDVNGNFYILHALGKSVRIHSNDGTFQRSFPLTSPSLRLEEVAALEDIPTPMTRLQRFKESTPHSYIRGAFVVDDKLLVQVECRNCPDSETQNVIDVYNLDGELLHYGIDIGESVMSMTGDQLLFWHYNEDGNGSLEIATYSLR